MTGCHMPMGTAGPSSLLLPGAELGAGKAGGRPTPARLWFLSLAPGERETPAQDASGVRAERPALQVQAGDALSHNAASSGQRGGLGWGRSQIERAIRPLQRCYRKSINHRVLKSRSFWLLLGCSIHRAERGGILRTPA